MKAISKADCDKIKIEVDILHRDKLTFYRHKNAINVHRKLYICFFVLFC